MLARKAKTEPGGVPVWASITGLLVLPILTAAITSYVTLKGTMVTGETKKLELDTGVKTKMIELALEIVKADPKNTSGDHELRRWAADVLDHFSDVKLGEKAKEAMIEQPLFGSHPALQRLTDTPLSRMITDTMRWFAKADIAMLNAGALRSNYVPIEGPVTDADIARVLPFRNTICAVRLKGSDVIKLIDLGTARYGVGEGRLLQVSGMAYSFSPGGPDGTRVCSAWLIGPEDKLLRLQEKEEYTVAMNDYLYKQAGSELGPEAEKILAKAVLAMQPGESPLIHDLVGERLKSRYYMGNWAMGRISVGCLPRLP